MTQTIPAFFDVCVTAIPHQAGALSLYEIRKPDGSPLPAPAPGDYVHLRLPDGRAWEFSLVGPLEAQDVYIVGARYETSERNPTKINLESLRVGSIIQCAGPYPSFHVNKDARHHVFITGGVGFYSLWTLIQSLAARDMSWELHCAFPNRSQLAFSHDIMALGERVHLHFADEPETLKMDPAAIIKNAPVGTQFYACAPSEILYYVDITVSDIGSKLLQVEVSRPRVIAATAGGFTVELTRSNKTILVPANQTILEACDEAGAWLPSSCRRGTCGACLTNVIEGIPDHRDLVLSNSDRAANELILVCCSGSLSDKLVLDA